MSELLKTLALHLIDLAFPMCRSNMVSVEMILKVANFVMMIEDFSYARSDALLFVLFELGQGAVHAGYAQEILPTGFLDQS